MKITATKVLVL